MALTRPPLSFLNTNSTVFSDPLLVLHQGSDSSDSDVGFVFNRANGLVANVALYWSEADKAFYTTYTNSGGATDANLVPTTYANLVTNALTANAVSVTDLTVTGSTSGLATETQFNTLDANVGTISTDITTLTANAATQASVLDVLSGNAVTQQSELAVLVANAASQASDLTTLLSNAATQADELTTLTANAATQSGAIDTINANVGSFQTYANTNLSTTTLTVSGDATFDTNTLFVDSTNNRVGIGNTAPASPLTVAGVIESTSGGVKFPDGTTQTTAVSGSPATIDDVIAYAIALG